MDVPCLSSQLNRNTRIGQKCWSVGRNGSFTGGQKRPNKKVWIRAKSIKNSVSLCDAFHLVTSFKCSSLAVHRQSSNLTASDAAHQIPMHKAHALLACRQQR